MGFLKILFGKEKSPSEEMVVGTSPEPIPDSELASDARRASELISGARMGETAIGLSLDDKRVFFVMKQLLSPEDIGNLRATIEQGKVQLGYRLFKMPTYPVFVVKAIISDNPKNPFWLETFPNIRSEDRLILHRIRRGGTLGICFHFYVPGGMLLFRAGYQGSFLPSETLGQEIMEAERYLESLPRSASNYQAAVRQVIQENPKPPDPIKRLFPG